LPLDDTFQNAALAAKPPKKRPPPFSLRLSAAERERLLAQADGAPLGSYIRAKILDGAMPPPRRRPRASASVVDQKALSQVLAALGQSRLSSNLNQLAHLANIGALPVTPELEAELAEALAAIRDLRRLLLVALGFKEQDAT
jgi:hypothetical protein